MTDTNKYPGQLVFGLDIGTRSIVGTVGYKSGNKFYVVAQEVKEHETRAMMDGQIHDIVKVGDTIKAVKEAIEDKIGRKLTEVCIAAAGRVLRTITTFVEIHYEQEKVIVPEDIYALDSTGVEKAYEEFQKKNELEDKFYCVGYSVIHYYMNGYPIGNLEGHKAHTVSADIIATFLPDDVVDGLYSAVKLADLEVASLTLEPIAAIQVAIPENFRMLNIALVDVGAGTSDISITKGGSIIAFGMLSEAGDNLTDIIVQDCLVDFNMAEKIKREISDKDTVEYQDIMSLTQTISKAEVLAMLEPVIGSMAKQVADKIRELNADKSVSAVFIVGGGGKIETYAERLAEELEIQKERVAIRGEEVMQLIEFLDETIKKDSLLVTPIGICLNFYEQSNNFIYVNFNKERIKLYDNNKLAIVDAAMQADFPKEALFPRRGKALNFIVNGKAKIVRGQMGEAAVITLNGEKTDIYRQIHGNDVLEVKESTCGAAAELEIQKLPEYASSIQVYVNNNRIELPKFVSVNHELKSGFYSIRENDEIETLNYYTVQQIADFMDVAIDRKMNLYVNNKLATLEEKVYENFSVLWTMETVSFDVDIDSYSEAPAASIREPNRGGTETVGRSRQDAAEPTEVTVIVNGLPVSLNGKASYVFVDIFNYIDFDLSKVQGSGLVTKQNGMEAQYMQPLYQGDVIEIYWKE